MRAHGRLWLRQKGAWTQGGGVPLWFAAPEGGREGGPSVRVLEPEARGGGVLGMSGGGTARGRSGCDGMLVRLGEAAPEVGQAAAARWVGRAVVAAPEVGQAMAALEVRGCRGWWDRARQFCLFLVRTGLGASSRLLYRAGCYHNSVTLLYIYKSQLFCN